MKLTLSHIASALFLSTFAVAGCSSETGDASEPVAGDEAAVISCGADKYNEALAHYKNAVDWSKERLAKGVCESDNGYQWEIADEASRAVMTCGAFRETIKSSPWAQPIRTVLADSLTLKSLTGELLVIKDSEWQNWTGVDAMLEGQQFWAPAMGAYGSWSQIVFGENGKATYKFLKYHDNTGDITPEQEPATFTIEKPNGEKGKRTIVLSHGGVTERYTLGVDAGYRYDDAPLFTLTPEGVDVENEPSRKLFSLVSECDA
ncbi:MAG: hypothetical protein KIT84_32570 [Labilithrix sp.]|nr:hypothetical protein [Labilithrix sp.]MCW5815809.1 hypothetical protein [Labilithrix sp.]